MSGGHREVLLIGSMPIRPAANVFETVAAHLGARAPRIPDGETMGWLRAVWKSHAENPDLEPYGSTRLNGESDMPVPLYRLRAGRTARQIKLGPYGYGENARSAYEAFRRLKDEGKVPASTRYQVTLPGPGTTAYVIQMDAADLLPLAREALLRESEAVMREVPADELCIQLDVAMEAEHEEYLRRPQDFDTPVQKVFHWTHDQMAESVAWLADRIPPAVELGFHICSIWHHWPKGGQDNAVLVETANALSARISRPISYIQIPIIPEHDAPAHYAPFKTLKLHPETRLNLGLINLCDGVEGAKRRMALAKGAVAEFGVSFYCGLGMPPVDPLSRYNIPEAQSATAPRKPAAGTQNPGLLRAMPETFDEVLELHRRISDL